MIKNMAKNIVTIDNNEYQLWLRHLCEKIDRQRLKSVMQLNAATLQHYWWLGNDSGYSARNLMAYLIKT